MSDASDRIPYDVNGRLRDPLGVLAIKLTQWEHRDETKAQPHVRRAANEAMVEIDTMLRELYLMRSRLVSEIRVSDDLAMERSGGLLERLREDDDGD